MLDFVGTELRKIKHNLSDITSLWIQIISKPVQYGYRLSTSTNNIVIIVVIVIKYTNSEGKLIFTN